MPSLVVNRGRPLLTEQSLNANTTLGADLVREIWQRAATDPKDKSHGVQSVLRKLGVQVVDPTPGMHFHDLYRKPFVALLRWTNDSKILLCASGPKLADQPSWVPDWNSGKRQQWFNSKYADIGNDYTDAMQLPSELFDMSLLGQRGYASTKTSGLCHINEDLMVLYIKGVVIGTILWASDSFKETANEHPSIADDTHLRNISIFRDFYTCPSQSSSVPPGTLFRTFNGSNSSLFWTIQTMSSLPPNVILSTLKKEKGSGQTSTDLAHKPGTQVGDILIILEGVNVDW
ncbi:hypothetical protein F4813DRAFT_386301 [Daldinia decipiens]|uniref:uncharacterized protein n=1 Tax=Daldinia decipiens TaxID=326647 RepID=UPI0020C3DCF8|nr:uncharacterized protein F4813DRAFT_386301 [Daldinia decipiens]KAI1660891.1 hypothetical protein F4813DRAFT_386301 [Daldinia decipiens]